MSNKINIWSFETMPRSMTERCVLLPLCAQQQMEKSLSHTHTPFEITFTFGRCKKTLLSAFSGRESDEGVPLGRSEGLSPGLISLSVCPHSPVKSARQVCRQFHSSKSIVPPLLHSPIKPLIPITTRPDRPLRMATHSYTYPQ